MDTLKDEELLGNDCIVIGNNSNSGNYKNCVIIGDDLSSIKDGGIQIGLELFGKPIPDEFREMVTKYPRAFIWFFRILLTYIQIHGTGKIK